MKRIFFAVSFVFVMLSMPKHVDAQSNIDTVLVRNLQLRAEDWAWLLGSLGDVSSDSATQKKVFRIRDVIKAANPATWNTNVTVDSIPGKVAVRMYSMYSNARAGEITILGTNISTKLKAVSNAVLQVELTLIDEGHNAVFEDKRKRGKTLVLD